MVGKMEGFFENTFSQIESIKDQLFGSDENNNNTNDISAEQLLIIEFIKKIKNLNDEYINNLFSLENNELGKLLEIIHEYIKESINFKKKSLNFINRNYTNQIKEKDIYIYELEIKTSNLAEEVTKYLAQMEQYNKEISSLKNQYQLSHKLTKENHTKIEILMTELQSTKSELATKNDIINELKRKLRNEIFFNDDKDFAISDLEKEIIILNQQKESLKIELNNNRLKIQENIELNNFNISQLEIEKNELFLQNKKLAEENSGIKKNFSSTIEELKNIKEEFREYCRLPLNKSEYNSQSIISNSIIHDYLNFTSNN